MEKVKSWLHSKSCKAAVVVSGAVAALAPVASAAEGDSSAAITAAFTTGFQKMSSDALAMIATIVPIALGVAGVIFLAKKAMGWFKSLAK